MAAVAVVVVVVLVAVVVVVVVVVVVAVVVLVAVAVVVVVVVAAAVVVVVVVAVAVVVVAAAAGVAAGAAAVAVVVIVASMEERCTSLSRPTTRILRSPCLALEGPWATLTSILQQAHGTVSSILNRGCGALVIGDIICEHLGGARFPPSIVPASIVGMRHAEAGGSGYVCWKVPAEAVENASGGRSQCSW